jgi:bifunctional non-homologous end joining protein LigD
LARERVSVEIGGRSLSVSNLNKVLYPDTGFTKAAVIDYYVRIAPVMLPHLARRPLTMIRYPDGVEGNSFFEKRCPPHRPDWLGTVRLGGEGKDKVVDHCDVRDVAGLAWVANMAALELHTSLARGPDTAVPTMAVFDLDPGAPADAATCARVAMLLKDVFDRLGLQACAKTSGSKGLQVYVPVNDPGTTYEQTREFALSVGQLLERVHPELVLTTMDKSHRKGKVFVDWSQNTLTKTTVCAYSLRAKAQPTVSTPLTWDEVADQSGDDGDADRLRFTAGQVLRRVEKHGDLFASTAELAQELPKMG